MHARKAADCGVVPFVLCNDLLARSAEWLEYRVKVVDPEIDHVLTVGREIIAVRLEGFEDEGAGGDVPDPLVGRYAVVRTAATPDAQGNRI